MMMNRRRFITIAAAGSAAAMSSLARPGIASTAVVWRGTALGAPAKILIDGDSVEADSIISQVLAEIDRLEMLFSLYRPDSAISVLNRTGLINNPDPDFLALLSISDRIHAASQGAFDPTIQPAWMALAEKHRGIGTQRELPQPANWSAVTYSPAHVVLHQPGMAISLNGIAQGYITDRIASLMVSAGRDHLLVDMGELRAIGSRVDGTAWPVNIAPGKPRGGGSKVSLSGGRAMAVSQCRGTTFDPDGHLGHIIDPASGQAMTRDRLVAVESSVAALADGLSTALCLVQSRYTKAVLDHFPDSRLIVDSDN